MASLILYPVSPEWTDGNQLLERYLKNAGMIGEKVPDKFGEGFLTGDSFISLINFLGCAPSISFSPENAETADDFCLVRISQYRLPQFLSAERLPLPRCPLCRTRFKASVSVESPDEPVLCVACGQLQPVHTLLWRQAAGYASCFIEITSVYPQEAHPVQSLMNALSEVSQCAWLYFYK